jgi:hypothetical protein
VQTPRTTRVCIALAFAVLVAAAFWLLHGEASPLYNYAIWNPTIGNILSYLCLPAVAFGGVLSGNVHQPSTVGSYIGILLQWFFVAYLGLLAIRRGR